MWFQIKLAYVLILLHLKHRIITHSSAKTVLITVQFFHYSFFLIQLLDDINYTVILKDFLQKAILNVNEKERLAISWYAVSQDPLTLEGSYPVQCFCCRPRSCGQCGDSLLHSPGAFCSCPPHWPHFKDVHSINNKAGKHFQSGYQTWFTKMLFVWNANRFEKNVLSTLYSGSLNCFWSLSVLLVFFNKE